MSLLITPPACGCGAELPACMPEDLEDLIMDNCWSFVDGRPTCPTCLRKVKPAPLSAAEQDVWDIVMDAAAAAYFDDTARQIALGGAWLPPDGYQVRFAGLVIQIPLRIVLAWAARHPRPERAILPSEAAIGRGERSAADEAIRARVQAEIEERYGIRERVAKHRAMQRTVRRAQRKRTRRPKLWF